MRRKFFAKTTVCGSDREWCLLQNTYCVLITLCDLLLWSSHRQRLKSSQVFILHTRKAFSFPFLRTRSHILHISEQVQLQLQQLFRNFISLTAWRLGHRAGSKTILLCHLQNAVCQPHGQHYPHASYIMCSDVRVVHSSCLPEAENHRYSTTK